ncbi:trypsin-like serine protease [Hymenobacter persicinus]|uniref:Trypsin-like serine protease n=1 Tax=Hymenobacter persicinus TaxID=2025506 RepID=A0A4Q5LGA7_9BACT|nr:trypsin-like serine protease [Hymenobacter persicinus]RYU80285.1 trypsin-like serine protease [Hymenobacter persicinus]
MKLLSLLTLCCLTTFQTFAQSVIGPASEGEANKTLIIGGQAIPISQAPWQVSVKTNLATNSGSDHIGGGSIIEPRWILTSATAIIGQSASNLFIRAGATNQATGGQLIQVAQIIRHPGFNPAAGTYENDLALLQLSTPLVFNNDVQAIKYASPATLPDNLMNAGVATVLTGWGATVDGSYAVTTQLNKVSIPVISNANANLLNQGNVPVPGPTVPQVSANMIAVYEPGKGAGNLDGGGPMVIYNNNVPVLAGCSSWSRDPRDQYPSIGTRIKNYASWIQSQLPAPLAASISISTVPQLDDVARIDCWASATGGIGPYQYSWVVEYPNNMASLTNTGANSYFSVSGVPIDWANAGSACVTVRVTDSSNQLAEARACGNQSEIMRAAVTAFPNPADTYLQVSTGEKADPLSTGLADAKTTGAAVRLYDAQGTLKLSSVTTQGQLKLNTSALPEGIYHLQTTQGRTVSTRQVVIKH